MLKKNNKTAVILALLSAFIIIIIVTKLKPDKDRSLTSYVNPSRGDVSITISTTGVVEPQTRLEIKAPIGGRIESILVREGEKITAGEILAWMSSTERAALLDAARAQGEEKVKYWEEVYRPTPLISPIDGEVIVRVMEPGQTVTSADPVLVLSDRLIINAQFDETDIGMVKIGQEAVVTLDAYPEINIKGSVDHIAYESEIISNVTIYNVDILPEETPEILRSGMSVTIDVIEDSRKNVLTIPSSAIHYSGKRAFLYVKGMLGKIEEQDVEIGLNDEKTAEVVSGLNPEDKVLVKADVFLLDRKKSGSSPFMPQRRR